MRTLVQKEREKMERSSSVKEETWKGVGVRRKRLEGGRWSAWEMKTRSGDGCRREAGREQSGSSVSLRKEDESRFP